MPPATANRRLVGIRNVCARYNDVTPRKVSRWLDDRGFPQPALLINGRRYWAESDLDLHDRRVAAETLSKPRPARRLPDRPSKLDEAKA